MIKVRDFENDVIAKYGDEKVFYDFIQNNNLKLDMDYDYIFTKNINFDEEMGYEESVVDFLEDMAHLSENDRVEKVLPKLTSLSFYYARQSVSYIDVEQEGSVGLVKADENYETYTNELDFWEYAKFWVIREMVLFINRKIVNAQKEFEKYLHNKKHELEEGVLVDETPNDEIYITEDDLLPNIEAIEKKEKLISKNLVFDKLSSRLTKIQIEVLNLYFGFGYDKRFSTYEIEEKLKLPKDMGQTLLEEAIIILSSSEGKVFL